MALIPLVVRDGNNAAQSMDALQDAAGINMSIVSLDSTRATYRAALAFTPFATSTGTLFSIQGSSTKTVRIKRIGLAMAGTSGASIVGLQRTSALGSGGTVAAATAAKLDTLSAAATAVVQGYTTAQQTKGTPVGGLLTAHRIDYAAIAAALAGEPSVTVLFPELGMPVGQAIVLRGAADFLECQIVTTAVPASPSAQLVVEWEEDAS